MPELPEVETIRLQLSQTLPLEVERVDFSAVSESIIKKKDRKINLQGQKIITLERTGKLLEFVLESGDRVLSHLGMSGSWRIWKENQIEKIKHTHVLIKGNGVYWAYVDPRRFGNMFFFSHEDALNYKKRLGVDIASPAFNQIYIYESLRRYPDRALKPFLLDQAYFAGCGNYIASEICAHAGIRPTRKSGKISMDEAQRIKLATQIVLDNQLKHKGLTFSGGYSDAFGEKGEGLSKLVVFHQKTCGLCKKSSIKKIVQAQRATFYCPACQK